MSSVPRLAVGALVVAAVLVGLVMILRGTQLGGQGASASQSAFSPEASVSSTSTAAPTVSFSASPTPTATVSPSPTATPSDLAGVLASSYWVFVAPDGQMLVGNLAGHSAALAVPVDTHDSTVGAHVLLWHRENGTLVFSSADPATGVVTEVHRRESDYLTLSATFDASGTRIYFHGRHEGAGTDTDGGVRVFDTETGQEALLVPGTESTTRSRFRLLWSRTGQTLASTLCDQEACSVDLIDATSGDARHIEGPFNTVSITDGHLLGSQPTEQGWQLYDLATDEVESIASDRIARAGHGFAIDDSRFVVSGINADASLYAVVLVNAETGMASLVRQDPYDPDSTARLRPDLVHDRWVLFTADPLFDLLHEDESSPLSVLDLTTGEIQEDVGTIQRP